MCQREYLISRIFELLVVLLKRAYFPLITVSHKCFTVCTFYLNTERNFQKSFSDIQEGFRIRINKTRTRGIFLLTTSARLDFGRSFGPPRYKERRRKSAGLFPEQRLVIEPRHKRT